MKLYLKQINIGFTVYRRHPGDGKCVFQETIGSQIIQKQH